ncbi:hypothetical protein, partial [Staphylococcus pettenkoferi]|uniref:hypothetical protein n=1 Tax=Staphylococcus pettenkoferi TaxID=170573 RepID=UPI00066C1094
APMVVGLTFRKSRTLPGKSNPKGFFFYTRKEVNFFPKKLFEVNEIKIDETSERRNELTRGK